MGVEKTKTPAGQARRARLTSAALPHKMYSDARGGDCTLKQGRLKSGCRGYLPSDLTLKSILRMDGSHLAWNRVPTWLSSEHLSCNLTSLLCTQINMQLTWIQFGDQMHWCVFEFIFKISQVVKSDARVSSAAFPVYQTSLTPLQLFITDLAV